MVVPVFATTWCEEEHERLAKTTESLTILPISDHLAKTSESLTNLFILRKSCSMKELIVIVTP